MALFGTDFSPLDPADSSIVSQGASWIRDIKQRLKDFVALSFDPETGELLASAIPNGVTIPYGAAGTVYTSTGPSTAPVWSAGSGVPIGATFMWPASSAPTGYLLCQGGTQLIADYPALAAVVGVTFGGDGVNTFGVPDLRGRVPVGAGTGDAADATLWSLAQKKGEEAHTLTVDELPAISPTLDMDGSLFGQSVSVEMRGGGGNSNTDRGGGAGTSNYHDVRVTPFGGGQPHSSLQPSLTLNFIIKT